MQVHRIERAATGADRPAPPQQAAPAASSLRVPKVHAWHRSDDRSDARPVPGTPSSGMRDADDAARNVQVALDFYREVLGRNGIDGAGSDVDVEVGRQDLSGNAAWDGERLLVGTADDAGELYAMSRSLDIVAHEVTHGVITSTADFDQTPQGDALHESFADVFGELVQAWHEQPADFDSVGHARRHQWVTGEDIVVDRERYVAYSDLAVPGNPRVVEQHASHMRDHDDALEAHVAGGIPSRAAVEAARQIGSGRMARVWYDALVHRLDATASFRDAARATVDAAQQLYGEDVSAAVRDAWAAVGL